MNLPLLRITTVGFVLGAAIATASPPPFNDEFDDDKAGWFGTDKADTWIGKIAQGKFHYENLSANANGLNWRSRPIELEAGRDFEIALRIGASDGPNDGEVGIIWDYDPNVGSGQRRHFHVSRDGTYRIFHHDGTQFTGYGVWKKNPRVKSNAENELMIRRIAGRVFFLVNGSAIDAMDLKTVSGKFIGIVASSGVAAEADHFHVRYLESPTEARIADARKLETEARASLIAAGPPLEDFVETFDDNRRNWPFISTGEGWKANIADGNLEWENQLKQGTQWTSLVQPVNVAADYEISFRARDRNGGNSVLAMSWNYVSGGTGLELGFSNAGHYILTAYDGKTATNLMPWTSTSLVKPGEFNEIKARKLGRTLFIFVNGQVVADVPALVVTGDRLAVTTGYGTNSAFDEIRVTYPKLSEQEATAETERHVVALKAGHGKPGLGIVYSEARKEEIRTAQARKDAQEMEDRRWKLTDADDKQMAKVRKQFGQKKMLSLFASWGRPAKITQNGAAVYYNYKLVGRTQYYYWFQIYKDGKQENWAITNVSFTDNPL